jgi:hypothetical protein
LALALALAAPGTGERLQASGPSPKRCRPRIIPPDRSHRRARVCFLAELQRMRCVPPFSFHSYALVPLSLPCWRLLCPDHTSGAAHHSVDGSRMNQSPRFGIACCFPHKRRAVPRPTSLVRGARRVDTASAAGRQCYPAAPDAAPDARPPRSACLCHPVHAPPNCHALTCAFYTYVYTCTRGVAAADLARSRAPNIPRGPSDTLLYRRSGMTETRLLPQRTTRGDPSSSKEFRLRLAHNTPPRLCTTRLQTAPAPRCHRPRAPP